MIYNFWAYYPDGTGFREEASFSNDKEAIAWMNRLIAAFTQDGRALQAYYLSEGLIDTNATHETYVPPREVAQFNVVAYNGID